MSTTSKPSRRVTALATLAFTSALTGGSAHASATTTTAQGRTTAPTSRTATRPPREPVGADARLDLPSELDLGALAGALGVHPGRLGAAVRRLKPDETRSVGGLDPLTALAHELGLPPTDVYLAVARLVARQSRP